MRSYILPYTLLAGCLLILLSACTNEAPVPTTTTEVISFSAYTSQPLSQTRANDITAIPDGGSFGVYAIYHNNSTWAEEYDTYSALGSVALNTLLVPNFMKNQQVSYDGDNNAYIYSPLKYWPNTSTDKLSFMAYYPYSEGTDDRNRLGFSTGFLNGLPYIAATVKKDDVTNTTKDQVDILMSDMLADLPDGTMAVTPGAPDSREGLTINDRVHFYFRHALTKVTFCFIVQPDIREDVANLTVNSINITNIYNNANLIPSYDPSTKETTFAWEGHTIDHKDNYTFHPNESQLMMPQTLRADADLTVSYTLTLKSYGTSYEYDASGKPVETPTYTYSRNATIALNTLCIKDTTTPVTAWQANTHYIYTFRIGAKGIAFDAQVVDWGKNEEVVIPIE